MGQLFMYIGAGIAILIIVIRFIGFIGEYLFLTKKSDSFSQTVADDSLPTFSQEPREFELLNESNYNLLNFLFKKAPSWVMLWGLRSLFIFLLGAYTTTANIERLASAGAALGNGDIGLSLSHLWPVGKDIVTKQYRPASGSHPILEKYGLKNFKYLSSDKEFNYAMMEDVVKANDIDPSIQPGDPDYDIMITGTKNRAASEICENISYDITTYLISKKDWEFSNSHFLAKRNINRRPEIAEWFSDLDPNDNDNYFLNKKKLELNLFEDGEFLGGSSDGIYYDEEDLLDVGSKNGFKIAFRCGAKWQK